MSVEEKLSCFHPQAAEAAILRHGAVQAASANQEAHKKRSKIPSVATVSAVDDDMSFNSTAIDAIVSTEKWPISSKFTPPQQTRQPGMLLTPPAAPRRFAACPPLKRKNSLRAPENESDEVLNKS